MEHWNLRNFSTLLSKLVWARDKTLHEATYPVGNTVSGIAEHNSHQLEIVMFQLLLARTWEWVA